MAFPTSALPVTVEIAPGADPAADPGTWTWVDITSSVRLRDRIQITQGRADESARVAPSVCRLRLDNRTGDFTPRNPLGQWYGTLGRNTPLRVRVTLEGGTTVTDAFSRTVAAGSWGTATSGQAWTTRTSPATDYSVDGTNGRIAPSTIGGDHMATVDFGSTNQDVTVLLETNTTPVGASLRYGLVGRFSTASNYYRAVAMVTPAGVVSAELGARVAGTLTVLESATTSLTISTNIRVRFRAVGSRIQLKLWQDGSTEPDAWNIDITDSSVPAGTHCGAFARRESGNTSPTSLQFDAFSATAPRVDRFNGFVSSWPPRWDKSGRDATVPIEANGVLRRLGQGTPPAKSPMRRTIAASGPVAYWPCEDGVTAGRVASALAGHPAMALSGAVEFVSADNLQGFTEASPVGSQGLVDLAGGGSLSVTLPAEATAATATTWTVHIATRIELAQIAADVVLAEWTTPGGTYVRWRLVWVLSALTIRVIAYNSAGTPTTVIDSGSFAQSFGVYDVSAVQNGGNIDVSFIGVVHTGSVAGTLAGLGSMTLNADGTTFTNDFPVGHVAVYDVAPLPYPVGSNFDTYNVLVNGAENSFRSEAATERLARLCAEEGVRLSMPAVSADFVTRMGPQPTGAFLDLLYECVDADQGVLYEDGFGLGYLPREHRYNRPVAMALDFAAGHIAEPPEPADDDYNLVNRVKVRRRGGSSATAEDADSITAEGLYETEYEVNHAGDSQLADHAAWRLHAGR